MARQRSQGCRPTSTLTGGPPHLTGAVSHSDVERRMARSIGERCHVLWIGLYGGDCDFDDLYVGLAEKLGWVCPPDADLDAVLCGAGTTIDACTLPWTSLRTLAISVFDAYRAGESRELSSFDPRTWEEAVDDALFATGPCRACVLGVPGTSAEHRELAGWVLHRRTSWSKIEAVMRPRCR